MRPAPMDAGEEKWYSVNDAFLRARIRAWGGVSLLKIKNPLRNTSPKGTEPSREVNATKA